MIRMSKHKSLKLWESMKHGKDGAETKKPGWRKRLPWWSKALIIALGSGAGAAAYYATDDTIKSKRMKDDDQLNFWVMDAKRDSTGTPEGIIYTQYDDVNRDWKIDQEEQTILNMSFQDVINHNKWLLGEWLWESSLQAIIMGEDELKTKNSIGKLFQNGDDKLLSWRWGEERSKYWEWLIWKTFGLVLWPWSYWPFQVQRESIDDYKGEVDVYNKICNDIANFMLPDKNNEREKLYKQLGYPTPENMVEDIKNHKINMYEWWWRFQIAYWIVLINQVDKRIISMVNSYDWDKWYERWDSNTRIVEREHRELLGNGDKIMSPYILQNQWLISYKWIWQIFNDNVFKEGVRPAYRCMDHIEKVDNSNYLFWLSLLELDEWFNSNDKWELDILIPTWRFWDWTVWLVNKHFNQNFNKDDEGRLAARKFMDELPTEELEKLKEKGLNKFEQNMRLLYTLNPGDKNWINEAISKYMSECLDLSFNHMYAAVTVFSDFIHTNCWDQDKNNALNDKRQDYVKNQNKKSLEYIKKIMTDEESFISFTWLDGDFFKKWIKYSLWPTELWATDRVWQTWLIVPVIQDNLWGKWNKNEQNSIARFDIWVRLWQEAKIEQEKWIRHTVEWENGFFHMGNSLESTLTLTSNPKEYVRRALFNDEIVNNYLESQCITSEWNKIVNPLSIPDELIEEIVRDENWDYFNIETIKPWDTIRFKIDWKTVYKYFDNLWNAIVRNNLWDITNRRGIIMCEDNLDWTYTVKPGANLQIILSECCEKDKRIMEKAIRVNNKLNKKGKSSYGSRPENVIIEMIRDEKWNKLKNPKKITPGQKIRINGLSNETLCVNNGNWTYTIQKNTAWQAILSHYYEENTKLHNMIINLNEWNPIENGEISDWIVEQMIVNIHWEPVNTELLKKGDVIKIWFKLNNRNLDN